jgi:hypothetical protein
VPQPAAPAARPIAPSPPPVVKPVPPVAVPSAAPLAPKPPPVAQKPIAPGAPAPAPLAPPRAAAPPPDPSPEATLAPGMEKIPPGVVPQPVAAAGIRGLTLVGPGGPFALGLGTFSVGRAIGSNVRLDDQQSSRAHARITITSASATVEDLQTVNGTLVNGREVKAPSPLRHGDTVQFGSSSFKVELIAS